MKAIQLPIEDIDTERSRRNPWSLTPTECFILRVLSIHGRTRTAAAALGISHRVIEGRLVSIREKISSHTGLSVQGVTVFVLWTEFCLSSNTGEVLSTKDVPAYGYANAWKEAAAAWGQVISLLSCHYELRDRSVRLGKAKTRMAACFRMHSPTSNQDSSV